MDDHSPQFQVITIDIHWSIARIESGIDWSRFSLIYQSKVLLTFALFCLVWIIICARWTSVECVSVSVSSLACAWSPGKILHVPSGFPTGKWTPSGRPQCNKWNILPLKIMSPIPKLSHLDWASQYKWRGWNFHEGGNTTSGLQPTYNWLVVSTPLKNISQLGVLFPIYGKIKFMFQTTNQIICHHESNPPRMDYSKPSDTVGAALMDCGNEAPNDPANGRNSSPVVYK